MIDVNLINGIALACEGDAVYSMYIRRHLIFQGMTKPNKLHQAATRYVSARAQASLIESMLEQEILTEKVFRKFAGFTLWYIRCEMTPTSQKVCRDV